MTKLKLLSMFRSALALVVFSTVVPVAFACERLVDKSSRFLLESDVEESTFLKCSYVRLLFKAQATDKPTFLKKLEVEVFDDKGARLVRFPPELEQPSPGYWQTAFCLHKNRITQTKVNVYSEYIATAALSKQRTHVGKGEGCFDLEVHSLNTILKEYPVSVIEKPDKGHSGHSPGPRESDQH